VAVLEEVSETLPAGVVAPGLVEEHVVPAAATAPAAPAKKAAKTAAKAAARRITPPDGADAGLAADKGPARKAAGQKRSAAKRAARDIPASVWVEPTGSTCPPSHPVKAKLTSRLFQVPGMFAYDRTRPDRCYTDEAAAVAEGFTRAKR
jgi:hypothetical protein